MSKQNTQTPKTPIAEITQAMFPNQAAERKAACKAALRQRLNAPSELIRVDNTGDLELYVKTLSVAEADTIRQEAAILREKYARSDIPFHLREAALEIFDADGLPYFDPHNDEDMHLLASLPPLVYAACQAATLQANGGDALKNLLAAESGS